MPPPSNSPSYHLLLHPKSVFVYQLSATASIPAPLLQALSPATGAGGEGELTFRSITWTREEVSIVTDLPPRAFPELKAGTEESLVQSGPDDWECVALYIRGPMELTLTGVLSSLITPLKEASVPIFTLATWNTDYVLIPIREKMRTLETLRQDGWTIVE